MFPESRRIFPESRRTFPKSSRTFPKSLFFQQLAKLGNTLDGVYEAVASLHLRTVALGCFNALYAHKHAACGLQKKEFVVRHRVQFIKVKSTPSFLNGKSNVH
jgi:hypothetical protein